MPTPKKKTIKSEPPATLVLGVPGKTPKSVHKIYKDKKGDVIVDHAGNKGKYDKINLTKKAGAKTIKAGVKATKDWHKKNG